MEEEPLESLYLRREEDHLNFPRSLEDHELSKKHKHSESLKPSELKRMNQVRRTRRTATYQRRSMSQDLVKPDLVLREVEELREANEILGTRTFDLEK